MQTALPAPLPTQPEAAAPRARREAMKPHKAAVLNACLINDHSAALVTKREDRNGVTTAMDWWRSATNLRHTQIRELLKTIEAAPDEPTEGR